MACGHEEGVHIMTYIPTSCRQMQLRLATHALVCPLGSLSVKTATSELATTASLSRCNTPADLGRAVCQLQQQHTDSNSSAGCVTR